jgi:primosomal protein N'
MKKANNNLRKLDYFSSIDKLSDDFMPKLIGSSKTFDPYPNTWGRQVQRSLHIGPAQEKQINKKQITELIHELKEKKLSAKKAAEDLKEIKNLSKKFMNKPWSAVPERYRKKYVRMDFDGDGVKNSKDCYPFDYDRQGWAEDAMGGIYDFFTRKAPEQIGKLVPTFPNLLPDKVQERFRTNYGRPQTLHEMNVNRGIITPDYNLYTGPIPPLQVISIKPDDTSPITTPSLDPDRLVEIMREWKTTGDIIDNKKMNDLYDAILEGKINDPKLKADLEAKMSPYQKQYDTAVGGLEAGLSAENKRLQGIMNIKERQMEKIGGINLANKLPYARAQDILNRRSEMAQAAANAAKKIEADKFDTQSNLIATAQNKLIRGLAQSELDARKSEYTTQGETGSGHTHVPVAYSQLTDIERARYEKSRPR